MSTVPTVNANRLVSIVVDFDDWILRPAAPLPTAMAQILRNHGVNGLGDVQRRAIAADFTVLMYSPVPDDIEAAVAEILWTNGVRIEPDDGAA